MTQDEVKSHYGMYPTTSKPRDFSIGRLLAQVRWGEESWDTLTAKNECQTDYLRFGRVRNLDGLECWQFVCWRLVVTWAVIPK